MTHPVHPPAPAALEARLAALLGATFAAAELRRFLRHAGLPGIAELTDDRPEPGVVAKNIYMAQAAEKLVGQGLVTAEFLQAWANARPGRGSEILPQTEPGAEGRSADSDDRLLRFERSDGCKCPTPRLIGHSCKT